MLFCPELLRLTDTSCSLLCSSNTRSSLAVADAVF